MGKINGLPILQPIVRQNVDKDAVVITDGLGSYTGLNNDFAAHEVVNHFEEEYVRDGSIHTNTIEGAFSLLKRSIYGIYHQVTPKHLSRYCDETMFRYNFRKMKDANRFTYSLQRAEGRLTYKNLIQKSLPQLTASGEVVPFKKYSRVHILIQSKDGEIIAQYSSVKEAAQKLNIGEAGIRKVLKGNRRTSGGFEWKYL